MFLKNNKQKIAAALAATLVLQISLPAQAQTSRYIKMRAHVGNIKAKPVTLPSGEVVDFPYVANALFYSQVFAHGYFEESNFLEEVLEETEKGPVLVGGELSNKPLMTTESSDDVALLKQYGMGLKPTSEYEQALGAIGHMKTEETEPSNPFKVPRCQYNQPAVKLRGQVVAYEANFGGGVTIGYNGNTTHPTSGIGGNLSLKSNRLDMQFDAIDPLFSRTNQDALIASVPVKKNTYDISGAIQFVVGIPIGINFFFKSSIVSTIRSAMTKGLDTVISELLKQVGIWEKKKTGSWKDIWESRVIDSPLVDNDDYIAIAGGKRAYVQIGDQFRIKNMFWDWAGKPCESRLGPNTMATAFLGEAIGTVIEVGNYVAILKVQPINGHEQAIKPGAYVTIEKLK